jgi:hypothetical protein
MLSNYLFRIAEESELVPGGLCNCGNRLPAESIQKGLLFTTIIAYRVSAIKNQSCLGNSDHPREKIIIPIPVEAVMDKISIRG